ncbi:TIGR04222 domain-containing membrane protein [Streptomyces sp. NPDC059786]|uniref:TIGR04222 domain-containing membrane protein n=1 Tax=Streptomyces sp. NPDC059786 TaxID=3346946 RepID=UPI00364C8C9C
MLWVLFLLLAWAAAGLACTRLCLAAVHAATADTGAVASTGFPADSGADRAPALTLYEAAFLSGGPVRVADLTLVSMARQRRLLLAHTGWATVVDPDGRDDMERSVLGAIGPRGQARIAPVRRVAAAADSVRRLADRLAAAGLAVPDGAPTTVAGAVRQVRAAAAAAPVLGATALLMPGQFSESRGVIALWFALPLAVALLCLAIARFEVHPYNRWASPAGQRALAALAAHSDGTYLASVAVHGVRAAGEPDLRAAFAHRER